MSETGSIRRKRPLILGLSVAAVVLVGAALFVIVKCRDSKVVFRYCPPDGTVCVGKNWRKMRLNLVSGQQLHIQETGEAKTVVKQTATGYSEIVTPLSVSIVCNGKRDMIREATGIVTVLIDRVSNGRPVRVRGYERLADIVKKRLNKRKLSSIERAYIDDMGANAMNNATAEWEQTVAPLLGRDANVGSLWHTNERMVIEGGATINLPVLVQVIKTVRKANLNFVVVHFDYNPRQEDLRPQLQRQLDTQRPNIQPGRIMVTDFKVAGSCDLTIAPASMLLLAEHRKLSVIYKVGYAGRSRGYSGHIESKSTYHFVSVVSGHPCPETGMCTLITK